MPKTKKPIGSTLFALTAFIIFSGVFVGWKSALAITFIQRDDSRLIDAYGDFKAFDENSRSIKIWFPEKSGLVPVIIFAHGGGGFGRSGRIVLGRFRREGFATIGFDAFRLNGLNRKWVWQNLSNESKQEMISKVLDGAYAYANARIGIKFSKIFFYGLSNGARSVLRANEKPERYPSLSGIISEGTARNNDIALKDCNFPTLFLFGEKDNAGARYGNEIIYSAIRSSLLINGEPSSLQHWVNFNKDRGCNFRINIYQNSGHNLFSGLLRVKADQRGLDRFVGSGATPQDHIILKEKIFTDIFQFFTSQLN